MVHEPSFFTFAGHDVRRLRSRSVAVIESLSPAASKRKLERMGMVVLRSTTPWVAVSSRNRSFLLTLISIVVPASVPTEEGIICGPLNIIETDLFHAKQCRSPECPRHSHLVYRFFPKSAGCECPLISGLWPVGP